MHKSSVFYIGYRAFEPVPSTEYPVGDNKNNQTSKGNRSVVKCLNGYWVMKQAVRRVWK